MRSSLKWLSPAMVLMLGCGPHYARVVLPTLPAPSASEDERRRALGELLPSGQVETLMAPRNGGTATQTTQFIMLQNGTRVEDPRDLVPLVPAASATATYAGQFESKMGTAGPLLTASLVGVLAAVGLVVAAGASAGVSMAVSPRGGGDSSAFGPLIGVSLATFAVSAAVAAAGIIVASSASADRNAAFLAYPNDLQRRLGFLEAPTYAGTPRPSAIASPTVPPAAPSAPSVATTEPTAPLAPTPAPPAAQAKDGRRCIARELPEWQGASAREKQALLKACSATP